MSGIQGTTQQKLVFGGIGAALLAIYAYVTKSYRGKSRRAR